MNHEQCQAIWRNAFQASGAEIYIFCDHCSSMRSVPSTINFSLAGQAMLFDQPGGSSGWQMRCTWWDLAGPSLEPVFSCSEAGMNPRYKPLPSGTNPLVQTRFVPGINWGNDLREVYTSLSGIDGMHSVGLWILMTILGIERAVTACTRP